MSENEKREVYIACKTLFAGPNASLRKLKCIEKQMTQNQATLKKSIPNLNINRAANIAQYLLQKGAFESDSKAKAEIPSLSAPSPAKKPQNDVPKPEVVHLITNDPKEINRYEKEQTEKKSPETKAPIEAKCPVEAKAPVPDIKNETNTATKTKCTTEPLFFPYSAQHSIMTSLQQFLEECFFEYTKKWLPSEVEARQWDCAAVKDLSEWTDFLKEQVPKLPNEALQLRGPDLNVLFFKIRQLRNTAVHRSPTPTREVGSMVLDAMRLAEVLQDPSRIFQLKELYNDIQNKTQEMELSIFALQDSLVRELAAIQIQREALNQLEERLRAGTRKSERESKALAGVLVQQSVGRIFSSTSVLDDLSGFETADEGGDGEDGADDES